LTSIKAAAQGILLNRQTPGMTVATTPTPRWCGSTCSTGQLLWRRHVNTGKSDAVLYTVSDTSLMRNIGQHRAQGKAADNSVVQLVE
jgi:hypothetical protein